MFFKRKTINIISWCGWHNGGSLLFYLLRVFGSEARSKVNAYWVNKKEEFLLWTLRVTRRYSSFLLFSIFSVGTLIVFCREGTDPLSDTKKKVCFIYYLFIRRFGSVKKNKNFLCLFVFPFFCPAVGSVVRVLWTLHSRNIPFFILIFYEFI